MVLDLESKLGISQDDTEALLRHYAVAGPLIERIATLLSDLMRRRTHELDRAANQD